VVRIVERYDPIPDAQMRTNEILLGPGEHLVLGLGVGKTLLLDRVKRKKKP
jgi:hypothetical protein